jgi:carbonic anhydrase
MLFVVFLCLVSTWAQAEENNPRKVPANITQTLRKILQDNGAFVKAHPKAFFAGFRDEQHPLATVVACSDSRFHTDSIDRVPDDDLYMVRNIGNQIDSALGSVEYGLRHLHTPLLLIIGHVGCGAVKAAMSDYSSIEPGIRRELDGLHLAVNRMAAQGTFQERWLTNVVGNVHQQVKYAMLEYAEDMHAGRLSILGAVYDFRDDLKQGAGRLVIVNLNGETDPKKITAALELPELHTTQSQP